MSSTGVRIAEVERRLKKLEKERHKLMLELEAIKDGQPVTLAPDDDTAPRLNDNILREIEERVAQRQKERAKWGQSQRQLVARPQNLQQQMTQSNQAFFNERFKRYAKYAQKQGDYVQQQRDQYRAQVAAFQRAGEKKNEGFISRVTKAFGL